MIGGLKLRFEPVRQMCLAAIADRVTPGLVVLVASGGEVQFCGAFGDRQAVPERWAADAATVYDVASLTKALATSVVAMRATADRRLRLDDAVVELVPEFSGPGRDAITIRHLLSHSSGLPAHRPFWRRAAASAAGRWTVEQLAAHEPIEYPPGTHAVYSDLGFIVLGWLLERTLGERLDVAFHRVVAAPLGLEASTFVNLADADGRARLLAERSVAATQICPARGHVLLGEVDDLNAAAMGGIAGHAGLFSTAAEVSAIAAALTRAWRGDDRWMPPEIVRAFWSPSGVPGSTWRLGWDGPSASGSQAGSRISRTGIGHLGFTGCSLWIDPGRETWVVLLSNRVHPVPAADDRFRQFRPALHDAALQAVGYDAGLT
jgi:serine-type D-Ala-D-Ala carboxypeptidase